MNKPLLVVVIVVVLIAVGGWYFLRGGFSLPGQGEPAEEEPAQIEPGSSGSVEEAISKGSAAGQRVSPSDIQASVGERFNVVLASNPSLGRSWRPNFDEGFLRLIEKIYLPNDPAAPRGEGKDTFKFEALQAGETTVNFALSGPRDSAPADTRSFQISIQ